MTNKELLMEKLPDRYVEKVLEFISCLEKSNLETAILSESSLEKDWLKPEEEEAWKDL
jgi:hypothetical protein